MKRIIQTSVAALLLSCGSAYADVTIGIVAPLTGPAAAQGGPSKTGMELAIPKTIGGEKVNVIVLDDATDPTSAARNTQKLISEYNVDVVLGNIATPSSLAMANLTTAAGVAQFTIAPIYFGDDRDKLLFNVPAPPRVWFEVIAKDLVAKGIKKVGFIGFNDPWGDLTLAALKEHATKHGIEIVSEERYARADTSVSGQILKILSKKPEAVFVGAAGTPGVLPNLALVQRGFKGPIYNTNGVFNKDFNKLAGSAINGIHGVIGAVAIADMLPDNEPRKPVAKAFIAAYDQLNGSGSWDAGAALGYDAALLAVKAIEVALKDTKPGTPEFRKKVAASVRKMGEVAGAHAIYNFNKEGWPWGVDDRATFLVTYRDGSWSPAK